MNKIVNCTLAGFAIMWLFYLIIITFNPIIGYGLLLCAILSFVFGFLLNYKFKMLEDMTEDEN